MGFLEFVREVGGSVARLVGGIPARYVNVLVLGFVLGVVAERLGVV